MMKIKTKEFKFWKMGLRSRHPGRILVGMKRLGGPMEYRFLRACAIKLRN